MWGFGGAGPWASGMIPPGFSGMMSLPTGRGRPEAPMTVQDRFLDYLAEDDEGLRVAWESVYELSRSRLDAILPTSDWIMKRLHLCQDFFVHHYQIPSVQKLPLIYLIAPVLIFRRVAFIDYLADFARDLGMPDPQAHWFRNMMNTILDDAWLAWWEHLAQDPEDLRYMLREMVKYSGLTTDNFKEFQVCALFFLQNIAFRALAVRRDFDQQRGGEPP